MEDGRIIDEPDVIQGGVLMRKGAEEEPTLEAIHKKVDELNNGILPPGVEVVPMLDRSDLLHFTLHTVMHNLTEGMILVSVILFPVSSQCSRRSHRRADHSVLSAVCLHLAGREPHSGQSSLPGRAGFRNGGGWRGGHGGKHHPASEPRPPPNPAGPPKTTAEMIREACHEVQRPVFYAIAIIITAYLPIFTLQRVEGRLFRPMAWTVAFALLGAMTFSILIAPVLAATFFRKGVRETAQSGDGLSDGALPPAAALGRSASLGRGCVGVRCPGGNDLSGLWRRHRRGVPAASG